MSETQTDKPSRPPRETALQVALGLAGAAIVLGLLLVVGDVHLLTPDGAKGELGDVNEKIRQVEGPVTGAFAALSGLGLTAGGTMAGCGMQQGIKVMTMSGLAGGGVVIGKGLIA